MSKKTGNIQSRTKIVDRLPDLITESDYRTPTDRKKVRVRITVTDEGVEVLGDSMYPILAEEVVREVSEDDIEWTPCG